MNNGKSILSDEVITSAPFVSLPHSARSLYVAMCCTADDEGVHDNLGGLARMIDCKHPKADIKALLDKHFIMRLAEDTYIIKHYLMLNKGLKKSNRITKSNYHELVEALKIKDNGAYTFNEMPDKCPTNARQMPDTCPPNVALTKLNITKYNLTEHNITKPNSKEELTLMLRGQQ